MPGKKDESEAAPPAAPAAEKKPKKAEGGKAKGPPQEKKQAPISTNPNFRHIVRMANSDLDGTRPVGMALTEIKGLGLRLATSVTRTSGINPRGLLGDLTEQQTEDLEKIVLTLKEKFPSWMLNHPLDRTTGEVHHYVAADLDTAIRDDVNQMRMIRCYRGIRHEKGQKVRGQRTRSNGRTGMAAGVVKKKAQAAAAIAAAGKKE